MAYRPPPELKTRIESIKKKFEVVEKPADSESSDQVQLSLSQNGKQSNSVNDSNILPKRKSPPITNRTTNSNAPMHQEVTTEALNIRRQAASSPCRGNIRRTHAFRCDKTVIGRQASVNPDKKPSVVNNRVKMFEDKHQNGRSGEIRKVPEKLHGNSDIIFEKQNINKSHIGPQDKMLPKDVKLVNVKSPFVNNSRKQTNLNVNHACSIDKKLVEQEVNIHDTKSPIQRTNIVQNSNMNGSSIKVTADKRDALSSDIECPEQRNNKQDCRILCKRSEVNNTNPGGSLSFSNTLKAALKAPLPAGPPPKKPPRTFAHHSTSQKGKSSNGFITLEKSKSVTGDLPNNTTKKPEVGNVMSRSKTEPHIMLQKLESVLLKHQQGIGELVIKPRNLTVRKTSGEENLKGKCDVADDCNKKLRTLPKLPSCAELVPLKERGQVPQTSEKLLSGCFESLNCASNAVYAQRHLYEKLNEKRSEFFVESPLCRRKISNIETGNSNRPAKRLLNRSCSEDHIYAEPYAVVDVDRLLNTDAAENRSKFVKSSVIDNIQNKQALHYMCTPISALDRIDALLNCDAVNRLKNINEANLDLRRKSSDNSKTDLDKPNECESDERIHSRKARFLQFTNLVKGLQPGPSELTNNKLDRNKVQFFINQAFGSPLHGMPLTPLDSTSDCESVLSTTDEPSAPILADDDVFERGTTEAATASSMSGTPTGENLNDKQQQEMAKVVEQRKVYVRRVSSRVFSTRQRLNASKQFSRLYHCIMLLGLNLDGEKRTKVPYIKSKYPPNAAVPPFIEHLCFPDASDWPPPSTSDRAESLFDEQSYSLVVTNETGQHMFGYCRRVKPEGTTICLPLAYCILSPFRAKGFYFKILSELESRHGQPEWLQTAFIKELYGCEFPNPGNGLKLPDKPLCAGSGSLESLLSTLASQLRRPLDSRLEERDLTLLFSTLSVPTLLQVFGSLLLERKVLFISNSLSKLSSCIEALHSILYPFSWEYTFIPVLPSEQIGVCEAPTPFIIGVLKDKSGKALNVSVEEGIVVDLEESSIVQSVGDESTILPPRMKKCLKVALQLVNSTTQDSEPARNVLISEAFIRMFVEICGHYCNHIVTQQDGKKVFERESFIKAVPSQSTQLFLEWFTETAMFSVFLENRLNEGAESKGLFEQRVLEHSEEMEKNTMLFLRNYKAINKKVKTLGDRLKDWTPFT